MFSSSLQIGTTTEMVMVIGCGPVARVAGGSLGENRAKLTQRRRPRKRQSGRSAKDGQGRRPPGRRGARRRQKSTANRTPYRRLKNFLSTSPAASRESALEVAGRGGSLPGAFLSGRLKLATMVALSEAFVVAAASSGATVSSSRN